jgi:glucose/arabinose dehydrogenase
MAASVRAGTEQDRHAIPHAKEARETGDHLGRLLLGSDGRNTIAGGPGDERIFGYGSENESPTVGRIQAKLVGTGFAGAVSASAAPGDPDRLYVIRKDVGEIHILSPETGRTRLFLNIPDDELSTGGEEGLLGLAFHPDYAANGRFFVHLVNAAGDIEIREYRRSADSWSRADPEPVKTVITIPHPTFSNHNGGAIAFSPKDGNLYIALGDGGGAGDPDGNAQNLGVLLGKILRIDVNGDDFPGDQRNYAIPEDNPFVGKAGRDEIWAYGLRNPWRIAFDKNGDLYIGDVGQNAREEIDVQPAFGNGGENYGWDLAEGSLGNPPPGSVLPVFEYGRDLGRVVTGGHVYRGEEPSLKGAYFFADFGSGRLWTLKNGKATDRTGQFPGDGPPGSISSFGIDGAGEIYAATLGGSIYRLVPRKHAGDIGDRLKGGGGNDSVFGGPGNDRLEGNRGRDALFGGFGDDVLKGGRGADQLLGGRGGDRFVFDTPIKGGPDRIEDMRPNVDRIVLDRDDFRGIGQRLDPGEFHIGKAATEPGHRVVYDPGSGFLTLDRNGSAAGGEARFARLDEGLGLDAGDFVMI